MGKLIATAQATVGGVVDPVGEWVQADGDHGDYSFERQARSGGLVLGRSTYEGLAGVSPGQTGKGADMGKQMPKFGRARRRREATWSTSSRSSSARGRCPASSSGTRPRSRARSRTRARGGRARP